MTDKNRQKGNESVGEKSDGLARDMGAREALQKPGAWMEAQTTFVSPDAESTLQETVERTIEVIERQLDLIGERAPGEMLDKRPVVQSLQAHVRRLRVALARPAPEALPVDSIRDVLQKMVDAKLEDAIGPNHLALCLKQMANEALDILKAKCRVCGHARHPGSSCVNFAPEALGAAQTWQPIETAPKDGTEILLYAPPTMYEGSSVSERVTAGKWHEWVETSAEYHATTGEYLGRYEQDSGAFWLSWDGGFTEEYPPTHWMPLPTPPATTAKDQS